MTAPPRGAFLRRVAIRGDATQLGLLLVVLAFLGVVIGATTGPGLLAMLAVPTALGGLVLVRWGRRLYRAALAEAAAPFLDHDPGPTPVLWISDAVWRARNGFDPSLDAPMLLLAEVDPDVHKVFGSDADGAFRDPVLRRVTDAERDDTPVAHGREDAPPPGDDEALLQALRDTPGRLVAVSPRWPVCCGRLTTLVALTTDALPDGARWLAADPEAPVGEGPGQHGYVCRACGRAYATDPAW